MEKVNIQDGDTPPEAEDANCAKSDDDSKDPDYSPITNPNVETSKTKMKSRLSTTASILENDELQKEEWTPVAGSPFSKVLNNVEGQLRITIAKRATGTDIHWNEPETGRNKDLFLFTTTPSTSASSCSLTQDPDHSSNANPSVLPGKRTSPSPSQTPSLEDKEKWHRRLSSVGMRVKQLKRKNRFKRDDMNESNLNEKVRSTSSDDQDDIGQASQPVNSEQWFSKMDGVFEEVKDYEAFFGMGDHEPETLEDALKLLRDTEFHQRQAKTKFSKVISEGKVLIPVVQDSQKNQVNQTFEDLKKKLKELTAVAQRRISNLCDCYNFHQVVVEVSDLEQFTKKSLKDCIRRQEDDGVTTTIENQRRHRLLEKEVQWRQGRIEDIRRRAKAVGLESRACERLKNVEIAWTSLIRNVGNGGRFYQFERACEEICDWFRNAKVLADNEDYGENAEKTKALLKDFQILMTNAAEKCFVLDDLAKNLNDEGYPNGQKLQRMISTVKALSNEFSDSANVRLNDLKRVKEIHLFNKQADETLKFIEDKKNSVLDTANDYGEELESLASQIDRHEKEEESYNKLVNDEIKHIFVKAERVENLFPEPEVKELVARKRQDCIQGWTELQNLLNDRQKRLDHARKIQNFFDKHAKATSQITSWNTEVNDIQLCRNVDDARTSLETCQTIVKLITEYEKVEELNKGEPYLLKIVQLESWRKELKEKMENLRGKWDLLKNTGDEMLKDLKINLGAEINYEKMQERKRKRLSETILESEPSE